MFRRTTEQDIDAIMKIFKQAQEYFKSNNIDQWQNNYPNRQTILDDIQNGYSYVLVKEGKIVATAAISFDGEITYEKIYDGEWLSNGDFAVIHRIAVNGHYKGSGVSSEIIQNVETMCRDRGVKSIKVDTHEQNLPMQRVLRKNDFTYCGVIYLGDNSKRIAFEKLL